MGTWTFLYLGVTLPTAMRLLPCPLLLFSLSVFAQNAPPVVSITTVGVDEGASTVTVTYDLSDGENDVCFVRFSASTDGGTTFLADATQVTGDLGAGITPGNGRTLTWTYSGIASIYAVHVKVMADDGHVPDIQTLVDQVHQQALADRLAQVAVLRHHQSAPNGSIAVRDTLHDTFQRNGLQTTLSTVSYGGADADNVLGRQPGLVDEARTCVVDAHYDAVASAPGADDNATGVCATLEIARILSQYTFKHSIRYIGFAFEEQGLVGSQHYVQNAEPAWEEVAGVLNMEMIGFYSDVPNSQQVPSGFDVLFPAATTEIAADGYRGNFLTVVGNTASQPLIDTYLAACDAYVPELRRIPLSVPGNGLIAPDLRRSDHAVFWDSGRQALMLTDGSNFRNPNYHTPNDTIGSIDLPFLTNSTKATLAAAAMIAEPINAGYDTFDLAALVGLHEHAVFPCSTQVFPNPAKDKLHIRFGDCVDERIVTELFDLKGHKITARSFTARTDTVYELPITGVAAGTYLLVLRAGEANTSVTVEVK